MSLLRFANLRTIRSTIENLGGRFRRKADPGVRPLKTRRLLVDPLEERTLLSVSPADWADTQVNQSVIDYLPGNGTIAGQSIAVDNDGDFVVVWTRYDEVVHPVTGLPIIDPATGFAMTDANIYARYLTDEVQRLTLPDEIAVNNVDGQYGTFSLVYGGAEVQKLSITATYEPFTFFQESVSGSFDLAFDVNGDGAIAGSETATIFFDETDSLQDNATDLQTALQGLGGALANATVQGLNPHEYLIEFGPETAGQDQPQITVEGTSFATGFLPAVLVSTVREPVEIANIPVSPDNPAQTAWQIQQAFLNTSRNYDIGPISGAVPHLDPDVVRAAVPGVTVTPVSATVFDVTFSDALATSERASGKKDHPELVISAAEDDLHNPLMGSTQIDVRTIKEPSPEFRVNPEEPDDPMTGLPKNYDQTAPAVAMDADGEFIIVWQSEVPDSVTFGSVTDIFARRFTPVGVVDPADVDFVQGVNPLGSHFRANTFTANAQTQPSVGMDSDGNFAISWSGNGQSISFFNGIVAQRYNRDGDRLGSEVLVNTEDTNIHSLPSVGMSDDGHYVVAWTMLGVIQAEVYDPQGVELMPQFAVNAGFNPSIAFDSGNNFVIGWDQVRDTDNIGITSTGAFARMYELYDDTGAVSGAVIRDDFRANTASFNPASNPRWPTRQGGNQVVLDSDGDLTISFDGYGSDVSYNAFLDGALFEELINTDENADLLAFFNPLFDSLPNFYFDTDSNYDVDGGLDEILLQAMNAGATDEQLGRLRAVLDRVATVMRGEANGAMYSQWDADPELGPMFVLATDNVSNAFRDGHNARYIVALDGLIDWNTFELGLSHPYVPGWEAVPVQVARPNNVINPYQTANNLDAALEAAMRTGVNWPSPPYEGPVDVRVIDAFEILARQGTYWDLDNSFYTVDVDDYVFEVTFQGEVHDEDMYLWGRQGTATGNEVQILTISPFDPTVPLTGQFALTDGTNTSQNITFDSNNLAVTAAAIEAALINDLQYAGVQVTVIPGGPPYQFDITFAGQSGNTDQPPIQFVAVNDPAGNPMLAAGGGSATIAQGGQTQVGPPDVFTHTEGDRGTIQTEASIGMEPDGDFVVAWSQYDEYTSGGWANISIHYRRFDESTDTAGPLATDFLLPSGERIEDGAQITEAMNFITVTFDEEMMAGTDPSSVSDPENWALMRDGIEMVGGISEIYFGMNMAADLATAFGLNPFGSNKWESVIVLDGNGPSPGITALGDGHYEIVALNSLRDLAGNPLGRTGFNINGGIFSREFDVTVPTAGEVLVNTDAAGTQYTYPYSPQAVADDADGDYVVVWTDETVGQEGVYAKLYDVIWADVPAGRLSTVAEMMVINPGTGMPWANNEIHVADDPTATFASVARDADGDFVVTWSQYDPLDSWDVFARRYDAAGNPLGDAFGVNSETEDVQRYSTVAMDVDGDFVIAWQSQDQDGSGYGVYAQRYSPSGVPLGGINEVQMLSFVNRPMGTFALFWDGDSTTPDVTVDIDFAGNTFDVVDDIQAALADIGAETEVEAISLTDIMIRFVGTDGSQDVPQISIDHALITGDPGAQITVQTGVNGAPGEFLVNQTTENNQQFASIAMAAEGDFVITWTSSGQDGDPAYETNIYARQFPSNEVLREVGFGAQSFAYGGNLSSYGDSAATWLVAADDPALRVVAPGAGFDGVVTVNVAGGMGSGALLTSGSHILTASHVVTDFFGNPQNPDDVSVTFDMPTGPIVIRASQILVHPSYNGDPFMGGDVAIIALEQQAPAGAERYDIYRNTDELGQVGTKYGYGTTGVGATGGIIPPDGNKRVGQNLWEALGGTLDPLTGVSVVDALIAYDFDNGQAANDAFDFLLGLADLGTGDTNEVCGAPGDSGGPTFIGNLIAGVVTGGIDFGGAWDVSPGIDSSFGDVGFDTRVSVYANWIDAAISLAGGPEFLVNQTINEDQKWSSVAMDHDGDFVITWTSYGQDGVGSGYGAGVGGEEGVFARRYDSDVNPASNEFQVNTFADRNQQFSRVDMDADGDFVITWESFQDRPQPPFDAPGIDPDSPNSYGIYAQRYARTELVGQSPFLGPDGEFGGELAINSTKRGDQRYPGIALDHTGDYVIVWSGNGEVAGQEDEQGIFHQRFNKPEDDAGPVVADVLNVVDAGGVIMLEQVLENDVLETNVTQFVVSFGEDLSTIGGVNGVHSVLNTANWQLIHDGAVLFGGVASVEFGLNQAFLSGLAPIPSNKYEAVITFDADSVEPGNQPLGQGVYVLTASDSIEDIFGNALDGDLDGTAGGNFDFSFIVLIGISGPSGPGDPDADDDDPQINVADIGIQDAPSVATDAEGNFVVVWVSYGQFGDAATEGNIVAQRFNRLGESLAPEFIVNSYLTGSQIDPDVAMDIFGNFVVTWSGEGEIDDSGVFARTFDAFGVAQDDQFRVNQFRQSVQDVARVAMDANGDFVVSWTSYGQDGDRDGVFARRYNSFGQAVDNEFLVNTTWYNRQENSDVAMDADGNFAIVWASYRQVSGNSDYDLYAQRFDAAGNPLGGEFRINTYTNDKQIDAQIAMDADGDFVVVWASFLQSPDTSGYGVYARRYTPAGTPKDPVEFLVNETTLHWQRQPAVSMDDEGNFVVTWTTFDQDDEDSSDNGIYGRLYNADGSDFLDTAVDPPVPFGEFRINATTAGDQFDSAVAMDADGDFVVVWVGPDADQTGIFGRVVGVNTGSSGSGGSGGGSGGGGTSYSGGGTGGGTGPVALGLTGTSGDDTFEFVAGDTPGSWIVKINDVQQIISPYTTSVSFDGRGGSDTVLFTGTENEESVELWPDHGTFSGDGYTVSVINVESIGAEGLGGSDAILLRDSEGNDVFTAKQTGVSLVGSGFSHTATGFESVAAIASGGGTDKAFLYDSPGDDTFVAKPSNVKLAGDGFIYRANFFEFTYTIAREGGADTAYLFDSPGNDALVAKPTFAKLTGDGFYNWTKYFETVCAYSTAGGYDTAGIFDSAGNETFKATTILAEMTGKGFSLSAKRFEKVDAYASGGVDTAVLYDSPGDDTFVGEPTVGTLSGKGFRNAARRFDSVAAIANGGGNDVAFLYDSAGDDVFVGKPTYGKLAGDGYLIRFKLFDAVHAIARNGGNDVAHLYGSTASDRVVSKSSFTKLFSGSSLVREKFFEEVHVHAYRGATDTAIAHDATMETGMATRDNGRLPASVSRVLWLYDLEHFELRNDPSEGGTSVVDAVDEIFTVYWD